MNLRELERNATPAPWTVTGEHPYGSPITPNLVTTETGGAIAAVYWRVGDGGTPDADFIAALRNAAPLLLDVVDAADFYTDESHEATQEHYVRLRDAVDKFLESQGLAMRNKP